MKASLDTVAAQNKFEADHGAMHAANMDKADADQRAHQDHVKGERERQRLGGNQYPPFKTYSAEAKKWRT